MKSKVCLMLALTLLAISCRRNSHPLPAGDAGATTVTTVTGFDAIGVEKDWGRISATLKEARVQGTTAMMSISLQNNEAKEEMISSIAQIQVTNEEGDTGQEDIMGTSCDGKIPPSGVLKCKLAYKFVAAPKELTVALGAGLMTKTTYFKIQVGVVAPDGSAHFSKYTACGICNRLVATGAVSGCLCPTPGELAEAGMPAALPADIASFYVVPGQANAGVVTLLPSRKNYDAVMNTEKFPKGDKLATSEDAFVIVRWAGGNELTDARIRVVVAGL